MQRLIQNNQTESFEERRGEEFIPKSIAFLHGLEGGKGGTKHRYLMANYQKCYLKSMEMSKWKLTQRNSFVRSLLRNWCRPSRAAGDSLNGCLNIQVEELSKNRPDCIIGSSWGGAIGLLLVSEGHWDGPIILCAPALKHLLNLVGQTPQFQWKEVVERINKNNLGKNILFIHGTKDAVIPYKTSLEAVQEINGAKLITLEGGNHSLNKQIIFNNALKTYINDHYRSFKLQQIQEQYEQQQQF